jgi:trans-aconitate methyltransferase
MRPRPAHLTDENAAQFQARTVAERYYLRLPYPAELFDMLAGLVLGAPRIVLDIGTGTGDLARNLATRVDRVDAVDISAEMIAAGKALPGGDLPNLRWVLGTAEDAPLDPPYGLVTAGESLHWMDWERVLPRLASALLPAGILAIARRDRLPSPWDDELSMLIREHSAMQNYQDFDLIGELSARGLFKKVGEHATAPITFVQPIEDYIDSFHSMSSLSLERITPEAAADFAAKLRTLLAPYAVNGAITLQPYGHVVWGRPHWPGQ